MPPSSYKNGTKQAARNWSVTTGRLYESILDLPADKCLSIEALVEGGNVRPATTKVVAVDRDAGAVELIDRKLRRMNFRSFRVLKLDVSKPKEWAGVKLPRFDWCNLDTCNTPCHGVAEWLKTVDFLPGGELNVWLTVFRNSQGFQQKVQHSFFSTIAGIRAIRAIEEENPMVFAGVKPDSKIVQAVLYYAVSRYDCTPHKVYNYTMSKNPMSVYRYTDMEAAKAVKPTLDSLLVEPVKSTKVAIKWPVVTAPTFASNNPVELFHYAATHNCRHSKGKGTIELRRRMTEGAVNGSTPKRFKAAWKAEATKKFPGDPALAKIQEMIAQA